MLPSTMPRHASRDKIGVREESAAQLISRIEIYQELLLEETTSKTQLQMLCAIELDRFTTLLECRLYDMLARVATTEQRRWRYRDRVAGRRDYLSLLSEVYEPALKRWQECHAGERAESDRDKVVFGEEGASQLVFRVQLYQEVLFDGVTPKEQLEGLGTLELGKRTMRLEYRLYDMLYRAAMDEQRQWQYQERINGRRESLSEISVAIEAPETQRRAHRTKADWVQYLEALLRRRVTPLEDLLSLSFWTLEKLANDLQAEIQARLVDRA